MSLTLLILAAGLGSRYGGLKQLDAVGPKGETILDYSVADAARAGFGRVVFLIRRDIETAFRAHIGDKYARRLVVEYAFQEAGDLPVTPPVTGDRTKPWGTGHAVWCARSLIAGGFAVINADDYYGYDSFARLATFLRQPQASGSRPSFALVGFRLENTLSENGSVSRGVCSLRENRFITGIVERTGIRSEEVGPGLPYSGQELVSMNCWAFTPALFAPLGGHLRAFIETHGGDPKSEFYLPSAVSSMIDRGEAEVEVLPTTAKWLGVTYREDKPRVQAALSKFAAQDVVTA